MATLLQQGIDAFEKGDIEAARSLFEQVLQADDQNDRALVWLSRVARTPAERTTLLGRALESNPYNTEARAALQDLSAPVKAAAPVETPLPTETPSRGLLKNSRKPFRLSELGTPAPTDTPGSTIEVATEAAVDEISALRQNSTAKITDATESDSTQQNSLPLVPALIFGTLAVTAVGGILLLILVSLLT